MPQPAVLAEILARRQVVDEQGRVYDLYADIDPRDGVLMQKMIHEIGAAATLEIGCAYGISSLNICAAIADRPQPRHTIIDPAESSDWHNIGIANLRRAGFDFFTLFEQPSDVVLPELVKQGLRVSFALIDGSHLLDVAMLDFLYVDKLLEIGGVVAIDDARLPAISKMVRYLINYPHYELITPLTSDLPARRHSIKRQLIDRGLRAFANCLPAGYVAEVFDDTWRRGVLLAANNMVFLRKIAMDARPQTWHAPF